MNSFRTYPIHSQATAGLRCAGMSLRIGKPGFGAGLSNPTWSFAGEDVAEEAGS